MERPSGRGVRPDKDGCDGSDSSDDSLGFSESPAGREESEALRQPPRPLFVIDSPRGAHATDGRPGTSRLHEGSWSCTTRGTDVERPTQDRKRRPVRRARMWRRRIAVPLDTSLARLIVGALGQTYEAEGRMFHLTARVAWHDTRWNGSVCRQPSCNSFCTALDRIREERDDAREDAIAGKRWSTLEPDALPACKAESGAFMNNEEWSRRFVHPYAGIKKAADTHGHLKPTFVKIPSVRHLRGAVRVDAQERAGCARRAPADAAPPDEESPFASPWVFGRERQEAILKLFASRLTPERSLVFFYCKEGQPLGDTISRLVMGVGRIANVAQPKAYDVSKKKPTHLMWDLLIRHTIRPDGEDGFLLPYHDYLEPTGDAAEDARRETAAPRESRCLPTRHTFASSLTPPSSRPQTSRSRRWFAASSQCGRIREHGIAKGPWERREEWLNQQIAQAWQDRGPFPGLGPRARGAGHAARDGARAGASLVGHGEGGHRPVAGRGRNSSREAGASAARLRRGPEGDARHMDGSP